MKLNFTHGDRNLLGAKFSEAGVIGQKCSIQESSSDSNTGEGCIWLGRDVGIHDLDAAGKLRDPRAIAESDACCMARMRLSQSQVRALLPALTWFAEHGDLGMDWKRGGGA